MLVGNKNSLVLVALIFTGFWFFGNTHQMQEFPAELKVYSWQDFRCDVGKIYYDMGNLSLRRGDFRKALKSFTTALKYNATLVPAYEKLKFVCNELGLKEQAERIDAQIQSLQMRKITSL